MTSISKFFTVKPLPKNHCPNQVRPFLRWIGGKQKLVGSLLEQLPDPKSYDRYFEPFLGAGSLFLAHGFPNAVLNDLNAHLINTYEAVRDEPEVLHDLLFEHYHNLSRQESGYYYEVRELYNQNRHETNLEQAARFIFLIHTNFNGIFRVNKQGLYNTPFGKNDPYLPPLSHLLAVQKRLETADLRTGFYSELEEEIGPRSFVYLDPPYPALSKTANFTRYTIDRFSEKDHLDLAAFAHRIVAKGAQVMLSITGTSMVEELYPKGDPWHYASSVIKRTISSKNPPLKVKELIITSYPSEQS